MASAQVLKKQEHLQAGKKKVIGFCLNYGERVCFGLVEFSLFAK